MMSPSPDIDPNELTLSDRSDTIDLDKGPVIDTSDEFPLPDFGEPPDPKVLFPEATEEDLPLASEGSKPEKQEPRRIEISLPSIEGVGNRDWREEGRPLSELSFPSSDIHFSEDDDYFEPQLRLVRQPYTEPVELSPLPPLPPLPPAIEMDANSSPAEFKAPARPQSEKSKKPEKPTESPVSKKSEPPPTPSDSPVKKYVRKVKDRRGETGSKKVRPWVPIAGVILLGVGYFAGQQYIDGLKVEPVQTPVMIIASEPPGEVFAENSSLGKTPLALTAENLQSGMEVRLSGFQAAVVPEMAARDENKPPQKFLFNLEPSPVALSWDALPAGTTVWWNGEKKTLDQLKEAKPGSYRVKAKPSDRPAVSLEVAVAPSPGGFDVGKAVQAELAKQPTVNVGLALPEKSKTEGLSLSVKSLDESKPFTATMKVSKDKKSSLVLPSEGTYKISFAGDKSFKPTSQTVKMASGATEELSLKLEKKPKPKVAPAASSSSGGYNPAPVYRPYRPTYRPSGGGGGRIAPPSF